MNVLPMPIRKNNSKVEIPKATLYELYWEKQLDTDEIARKFNTTKQTVRRRFTEHGVPYHKYDNRELFVFRHRQRSYFYELYWGQNQTSREIAEGESFGHTSVLTTLQDENIPMHTDGGNRWYDKERGIPHKYKLPSDNPVTEVDNPIPNDPDPSKYIKEETSIRFDKYKMYQLYWGCGFTVGQIQARLDVDIDVYATLDEMGIPRRDYVNHVHWKPYKGVPPMFEWPDEDEEEADYEPFEKEEPSTDVAHNGMSWEHAQAGD